jgi:hypothetical protein
MSSPRVAVNCFQSAGACAMTNVPSSPLVAAKAVELDVAPPPVPRGPP